VVKKPEHQLVYQIAESPFVYLPDRQVDSFFIGRQKRRAENPSVGCDFVIRCTDSRKRSLKISRRHLEVHRNGGTTYVVNRSKLGTELNGQEIKRGLPFIIKAGDQLSIAGVLTICILGRGQVILGGAVKGGQVIRLGNDHSTVTLEASVGNLIGTQPEIRNNSIASDRCT
jgi:pSer/pThr/pTyr-binding forkhead associated (FHA) protein